MECLPKKSSFIIDSNSVLLTVMKRLTNVWSFGSRSPFEMEFRNNGFYYELHTAILPILILPIVNKPKPFPKHAEHNSSHSEKTVFR